VLVNIATGTEYHKQSIIKRQGILRAVLHATTHDSAAIRVASIWVIINLIWTDDKISHSVHERVELLRNMGVEDRLLSLNDDRDLDVRDRVKTALQYFLLDQQQYGHGSSNGNNGVSTTISSSLSSSSLDQAGSGIGRHGHSSSRYNDPQQQVQQESNAGGSSSVDAYGGGGGSSAMDTTHIVMGGSSAGGHDRR